MSIKPGKVSNEQEAESDLETQIVQMNEQLLISSVRQHELIEEVQKSERALSLSEEQFRLGILNAPIPVIMHAEDGEVLQISHSWTKLTGYTLEDEDVIQNWLLTRAYGFGGECVREAMHDSFLPPESNHTVVCEIETRDGGHRTWSFHASVPGVLADGRRFVVGMAEDITDRIRSEQIILDNQNRLAESQMRLAMELSATQRLQEVSTSLIAEDDSQALYEQILDAAMAIMRSKFASLQLYQPEHGDGGELRLLAHRGFNAEAAKFWQLVRPASVSTCGLALKTGRRVVVENVEGCEWMKGSADQAAYLNTGIHAVQTTPLVSRSGEVLGMISTHWRRPHLPTERDFRLLDVLARQAIDLIERAQAKETLRENERRLRTMVDTIPQLAWMAEPDGYIFWYNSKWYEYTGTTLEQMEGWGWRSVHDPEMLPDVIARWTASIKTGKPFEMEFPLRGADGVFQWFLTRVNPLLDSKGAIIRWFGTNTNIEKSRRIQEALRLSEAKYRSLFDSIDEGFCVIEVTFDENQRAVDYRFIETNPAFEEQSGLVNAMGRTIRELVPNLEEFWFDAFGKVALTGESTRFEHESAPLNRSFDIFASRIGDDSSRKVGIIFRDISRRKLGEANQAFLVGFAEAFTPLSSVDDIMQDVGARIGAYLNVASCVFTDVDETHEYQLTINHGWTKAGVPSVVGSSYRIKDYLTPEFERLSRAGEMILVRDTQTDPRTNAAAHAQVGVGSFVSVPFHRDGQWKHLFSVYDTEMRDWRDDEIKLIGELAKLIFPRLERARSESALRESEKRYRTLFNSIDQGFCILEMIFDANDKPVDYRFLEVNPIFDKMTGISKEAAAGDKTAREIIPNLEDKWFEIYGRVAVTGEPIRFVEHSEAMGRWFDVYACRVGRSDSRRVALNFTDITERRWMEEELRISYESLERRVVERTVELASVNIDLKTESKERLAVEEERVSILHRLVTAQEDERRRIGRELHDQLGQQVTALRLKLEAMAFVADGDEVLSGHVKKAQEYAKQIDDDVEFLTFQLRPTALDDLGLVAAVQNFVYEWSLNHNIQAECHATETVPDELSPEIEINLYRVVQEALNNVIKYAGAENVTVQIDYRNANLILIIEDDGVGFDAENRTPAHNAGNGLGLIGMRERCLLLDGTLEIESAPGSGTVIFARIPVAAATNGTASTGA